MKEQLSRQLRETRKSLNYTIEEVVDKTKLAPSVVKALESGHWGSINPTYLKGFLKIYCSFLSVPFDKSMFEPKTAPENSVSAGSPTEIPAAGREETEASPATTAKEPQRQYPKTRIAPGDRTFPRLPLKTIVSLAAVVILLLIIRSCVPENRSLTDRENLPSQPAAASLPQEVQVSRAPVKETNKEEIEVTLTVKKDCFVKVKREGKVVFEGVLRRGIVETWTARKEIELKLSDGTAVDIEVNGKILPPLTKMRKPIKSLKITPQGISVSK